MCWQVSQNKMDKKTGEFALTPADTPGPFLSDLGYIWGLTNELNGFAFIKHMYSKLLNLHCLHPCLQTSSCFWWHILLHFLACYHHLAVSELVLCLWCANKTVTHCSNGQNLHIMSCEKYLDDVTLLLSPYLSSFVM